MGKSENKLIGFLKVGMLALAYLILAPVVIGVLANFVPQFGVWIAGTLIILGLVSLAWPLEKIGLYHKASSIAAVIGGLIAFTLAFSSVEKQDKERLAELRATDPASYLSELKSSDTSKWLEELAALAPDEYAEEMDRQAEEERVAELERQEEQNRVAAARQKQIADLKDKVKTVPSSATNQNIQLYEQLSRLDPDNQKYRDKLNHYIGIRDIKKNQERSPEKFVKIVKFSWTKEAFGNVMELDITLKNELPFAVKDIEIRCEHYAPSGTKIDSNERTIFEILQPGEKRSFQDFNMGFIHSQATSTGCGVNSVTRM